MMIKAEMFEDKALLMDASGRVWQVTIGHDDQPIIQIMPIRFAPTDTCASIPLLTGDPAL